MTIAGIGPVFAAGVLGGLLGELLKWYQLRESTNLPAYARSIFYWVVTILIVLAGGALAVLYGVESVSALLAVNVGLTAPLIIRALAQATPTPGATTTRGPRAAVRAMPSLLNFLAGS